MARHAFIVGGTGQIGRAVAAELLSQGWDVTISSRGKRQLAEELLQRGAKFAVVDREVPGH
jgi:NAD(P)-dependent dehydrogenase (short-subunit alcohol dehydrogenase family)